MIKRLAPFVANGLIDFYEAIDAIVEAALERGQVGDWRRLQAWAERVLTREANACDRSQPIKGTA